MHSKPGSITTKIKPVKPLRAPTGTIIILESHAAPPPPPPINPPNQLARFFSSMLFLCGTQTYGVFRIFDVSKHREFCTIKKAYKLLSDAVKKRGHNYNDSSLNIRN
jgi:hypothetical protein